MMITFVSLTNDGGNIISGRIDSTGAGGFDGFLVKIDRNAATEVFSVIRSIQFAPPGIVDMLLQVIHDHQH